ncbi:transketolase [Pelagibacterium sp. 26DY04]|uniref:transketolase n=1 Tax=Pelagibacterium sp. 26DY04 TaxID=2967130 RepID=UPI002815001F|nr:transketolase [Pelagibacterium sp. 26DY04]WMT86308.1 transketolase [Pelagibacterium sp. 26DY04]
MTDRAKHDAMANAIRALSMDAVQAANSGHPGLPMGGADIATVLFSKVMKFDPKAPNWPDRDRFVLSAGHGSMLLYSSLYLLGYEDMTLEDIKHFRQLGYKTAGHPEYGHADGIETTTGPLGQGLGNSVGMAIAEAKLRAEFGEDLVNHHTYVYAGDGCLMEGISQEAISLAGHLKLNKLIVIWDNNDITIDGKVSMADSTDQLKRFEASGWATMDIDGHDPVEIEKALLDAQKSDKPVLISARTTIGFGSPNKAGTNKVHGSPLGDEELAAAKKQLGWEYGPFEVPAEIVENWRTAGQRGAEAREAWNGRLQAAEKRDEFERRMRGELPAALKSAMADYKKKLAADKPKKATRASSQDALEVINGAVPETLGGSADLTGSNNTNTSQTLPFTADDYAGRYIHYGIREHGMAAAMNGIALHGGLIPYGGTFMTFTDYCRPSIRLSALMGIRVGYVMTHDSIGLGEDGPTHQPVEHLAALRAIPNLLVFRPADAMEAAECWEITLEREKQPSILALSRQGLPALRTEYTDENLSLRGAYTIWGDADAEVVIFGTGSETQIAVAAAKELTEAGTPARAVSVPSMELFFAQPDDYRQTVFGKAKARVAVEAGIEMGWSKFLGETGRFVGMTGFGASGEISDLYTHFGITTKAVVEAAKAQL